MATQPSSSRRASAVSLSQSFRSRRSSVGTDDGVFHDEFGLESPATIDNAPLGRIPPPRQQFFDNPFQELETSGPSSQLPLERSSIAKHRLMIDDVPSSISRDLGRSLSTSSRVTITRSQSPYNGPTAPSHPYNRYPQLTRAASVTSQSTFRSGTETPFVPQGGPSRPYGLYTQNTVPEPDEDITTHGIPVGFPGSGNFQSSSSGSSNEVGDIVGTDGHIEQLPPYTRYADSTVAKGDMNDVASPRFSRMSQAPTTESHAESSSHVAPAASTADSEAPLRPREQFEEETEAQRAMKEGWRPTWKDTLRRETFAGMPLWGLLLIVIIVILSAIIGGVVGGVIGNKQGAERAYANGPVKTIWLDAVSATLDPNSSPLPTGHYQIPFNQSEEIKKCIPNPTEVGSAWGCMDIAYIGVNVFHDTLSNSMMAAFEDFSVNTQDFKYGPQPPDFNGTAFSLSPMLDKDAGELGVAMFFSVLFDKLTILPEFVLSVRDVLGKRRVSSNRIARSVAPYDGTPLKPGDRPWFCFWNSTINEFFIYVEEAAPVEAGYNTTTQNKYITYTTTTAPTTTSDILHITSANAAAAAMLQSATMATSATLAPTSFAAYNPTPAGAGPISSIPSKRSYETSAPNISNYPKLIKMVEKRKPQNPLITDYVQPYCQQMQVLDDWDIVPLTAIPSICIDEIQYTIPASAATANSKILRRSERDVIGDLESYCICEWTSY